MRRSSDSANKGQWFVVSAVIISGAFLALSVLFRSYFIVNPALVAQNNVDYYFRNIYEQLNQTVKLSDCGNLTRNLDEYIHFVTEKMADMGYLLDVQYTVKNCRTKDVVFDIVFLQTERAKVWVGKRPEAGGIK